MPYFSLIIPTYNESHNLEELLTRLEDPLRDYDYEIIVVDDDSPDGTGRIVAHYMATHPRVRLETRHGERGLSGAVIHGMDRAQGQILGVMDADLSHDERLLRPLIQAIEAGAELAIGSRRVTGGGADRWPWYRRFMSDVATRLSVACLNIKLSDPMSGYFVLRRSLYESSRHQLAPKGYKILMEIYCSARPTQVRELPYIFKDRKQDHSKLTPRVMLQFLRSLWDLKRR